jgi:hydroxymethylpyrimidine/phosphomethylpyrimidine kinase
MFAAHAAYGMSVVTAVTAQTPSRWIAVHAVPVEIVVAQLTAVAEVGVDAIKIGMLGSAATCAAVARAVREHWTRPRIPIVLDPLLRSTSGGDLLAEGALPVFLEELLPLATVVTPNLAELQALTGRPVGEESERTVAARELAARGPAVVAKGGHEEAGEVVDLLVTGENVRRYVHPRLPGKSFHGTGCALSSALACELAAGTELGEAVGRAIEAVRGAIRSAPDLGSGPRPVEPLGTLRPGAPGMLDRGERL